MIHGGESFETIPLAVCVNPPCLDGITESEWCRRSPQVLQMRLFRGQQTSRSSTAVPCRDLDYRYYNHTPPLQGCFTHPPPTHPYVLHTYQLSISKFTEVVDKSTDVCVNLFGDNET